MHRWLKSEDGEKVYECKLIENRLKIYVDKEYANTNMITMMNDFGDVLKDAISRTDDEQEDKDDAEKALQKAEKSLKRAQRELEKAKNRVDN